MEDTIAAISTSLGVGAISIIRISGPNSIEIVNKIVKIKNLDKVNSHTINYNFIIDGDKTIDEVLIAEEVTFNNQPYSITIKVPPMAAIILKKMNNNSK